MFLKGMKLRLPFVKKEGVVEEDIDRAEEADVDVAAAADALLTPMGGVVDNRVAEPVNIPQPLLIDENDKEIAEEADALLTPMGGGASNSEQVAIKKISLGGNVEEKPSIEGIVEEENKDELKDIFQPLPGSEAPAEEKKDDFMSGLFDEEEEEEESPVEILIASLPDINLEEVIDAAEEVKTLMLEW